MRQQPEDQIWNTLIAHARTRFDYDEFIQAFGAFDNERVFETMLFQIVSGFAEGESSQTIADHLQHDLRMLDYSFAENDFEPFVARHGDLFRAEVEAAKTALELLGFGAGVLEALRQVERILR